jgi:hypothetical protein
MAEQSWSEERARELRNMAEECLEAAAEIDAPRRRKACSGPRKAT